MVIKYEAVNILKKKNTVIINAVNWILFVGNLIEIHSLCAEFTAFRNDLYIFLSPLKTSSSVVKHLLPTCFYNEKQDAGRLQSC